MLDARALEAIYGPLALQLLLGLPKLPEKRDIVGEVGYDLWVVI